MNDGLSFEEFKNILEEYKQLGNDAVLVLDGQVKDPDKNAFTWTTEDQVDDLKDTGYLVITTSHDMHSFGSENYMQKLFNDFVK